MDKLRMESPDMTALNIDRIAALFPNCITEMLDEEHSTPEKKVYKRAVNFELLKQMLSPDVVDGDEAYEFTWVGKKAAIVEANKPIRKTLRPCVAESKDWDTTENLYIEGDNLEVLKLLQESYLGKVKMIYIDPPYNTGNDFIYADDFMRSQEEENEQMGMYDEDENRLFKNTDTNGRFHSDWCSMIYSRLLLARNLLTDDGVIFISIDDNELDDLHMICNEVFGEDNFESCVAWRRRTNQPNDKSKMIAKVAEYILVYAKNSVHLAEHKGFYGVPLTEDRKSEYKNPDQDPRGPWSTNPWKAAVGRGGTKYCITTPTGIVYDETWYGTKQTFDKLLAENRVHWTDGGNGYPRIKIYLSDAEREGQAAINFFTPDRYGSNQEGSSTLQDLMEHKGLFDNPKPTTLITVLMRLAMHPDSIILDFFSGSATTAHAVMQLNAEDGGHRKFIMVQLPEKCDEASEAYKAGYKNICEIGKERIRRAGEKIQEKNSELKDIPLLDTKEDIQLFMDVAQHGPKAVERTKSAFKRVDESKDIDTGFRVLKLDDTNMKDVYYAPDDYDQGMLAGLESNIKDDRTDLDLLFGCLIDWGLPLSLPYKSEQLSGYTVHTYNDGDLIACFDANIPESVVKEIAQRKPLRAVFRDSGFASSPEKINVFEIFKLYMPEDANDISKRVRVL